MDSENQSWITLIFKTSKLKGVTILTTLWVIIFSFLFFHLILWLGKQNISTLLSIVFAAIVSALIACSLTWYHSLKDFPETKLGQRIRTVYLYSSLSSIGIVLIYTPINIWSQLHTQPISFVQMSSLLFFLILSMAAIATMVENNNNKKLESTTWRIAQRALLPILSLPIFIILSLLLLDLTAFFSDTDLSSLYKDTETKSFLFSLYTGALASIVFAVTLYVAYIRHTSLKLSEKQFEHTQQQFSYTQTQKQEEEIEKRFQEGIKLLGNEQESIRLGGIFVLCEIVKDAVKALPYLENECVYYAEYIDDKEQTYILPYRLEEADNDLDTANQTELKKCYLKDHPSSDAQIGAYLKAFSLHEQILNILCAYIRTKTNHENYIKENYPSIFQKRYSHKFKEVFGKKGEFNHIKESEEKPSHEIQNLLNLLLKMPRKEKRQGVVQNKYYIPSHALGFRLNFNQAILKKADCKEACFEKASCDEVNFQYLICESASFKQTSLCKTDFQNTRSFGTNFEQAVCYMTVFQNTEFPKASFQNAECDNTNFQESKLTLANFKQTKFINAFFQNTDCTQASFQNSELDSTSFQYADCSHANFKGTTGMPNFEYAKLLEANFENAILHAKFKDAQFFDITKWPLLKQP